MFRNQFGDSCCFIWEEGVRHPEGPARILLQVIDREPEAVMRALCEDRLGMPGGYV